MNNLTDIAAKEKAFHSLYGKHHAGVFRHCLALAANADEARDLCQDVFAKCWLKITELGHVEDLSAYLFILTRNTFLNTKRRERREQIGLAEYSHYYRQLWPPTSDPILEKEYATLLSEAIKGLPLRQRQVFILSKECAIPYKQIARMLGLRTPTVKMHRERAVKAISKFVRRQADEYKTNR